MPSKQFAQAGQTGPPQSTPSSFPFFMRSVQVGKYEHSLLNSGFLRVVLHSMFISVHCLTWINVGRHGPHSSHFHSSVHGAIRAALPPPPPPPPGTTSGPGEYAPITCITVSPTRLLVVFAAKLSVAM